MIADREKVIVEIEDAYGCAENVARMLDLRTMTRMTQTSLINTAVSVADLFCGKVGETNDNQTYKAKQQRRYLQKLPGIKC